MPKVSVIIPTYNSARFIVQAIESVLAQTYSDYEVIVVDDGSTDDTAEALAHYQKRVKYVYQANQERSVARNLGVSESTGEYLAFLDSDDLFLPNKLAVQVPILDQQPEFGLVASGYQFVDDTVRLLRVEKPWMHNPVINLETLLFCGLTTIHAVLIRREWFDQVDGFDPRYQGPEDMDFWFRLSLQGCTMTWVREIVCQYRMHASNSSRSVRKHYQSLYSVLGNFFSRPDIPENISNRKDELFAKIKMAEAGRLFAVGKTEDAKECFGYALSTSCLSGVRLGEYLVGLIVNWQNNVWVKNRSQFLKTVFANLPPQVSLTTSQIRSIYLNGFKSAFYKSFEIGDSKNVQRAWAQVLFRDLSWLVNRGAWSILIQSWGLARKKQWDAD